MVTLAVLRIALLATLSEADAVNLDLNEGPLDWPTLPSFLQGQPEERQVGKGTERICLRMNRVTNQRKMQRPARSTQ